MIRKSKQLQRLAFALCFVLTSSVFAQETLSKKASTNLSEEKIPFNPEVKMGKLDNGLTYYIKNNGKPENKVELRLVVNAGSILENDEQRGLAHFMEHMNFNGTKNFEKNELVDYLQSIGVKFGAHLNAYTSFDETVYILPIPSDDPEKLEKGFQIIEDWAHNALLTDEQIESERGVVLEEYRLGQGANERMMQEYLPKMLYGSKYADRLPIGQKEVLENFDYDTLRQFYKDWYRPDLMAVIAVGDVDVATLEAKIKEHFGNIPKPNNPKPRESFELPNHKETLVSVESDKEASFSQVQVMFKDTEDAQPDTTLEDYRKSIVENVFSQMINNRLDELTNGENPPFVFGSSYYGGTYAKTKNAYQSFAMTSETGQLKALQTLLEENQRVKQHGFYEGEFERAKKDIMARMEKSFKDRDKMESNRIVGEYIRNFLENEPMPGIEWEYNFYKEQLPKIDLTEVNALISDYIKDENRVIILTGPEKEGLTNATEAEVRSILEEVGEEELAPYEDTEVASSLITDVPKAGTVTDYKTNDVLGTTTLTLSNGAKVTYKVTDFKNDEILFDAYSYGGNSLYSLEDYKATANANGGLSEAGVNGFDKTEMGKMMSGKIVNVRPRISTYSEDISGNASPKDLEDLFQLVHLYFTALNKDEKAYNSYIDKQKSFLGNMMSNPQTYFSIKMGEWMYGDNPRYMGFPTPEMMDEANYDLAYEKYKERFADAGDFHFYFVGNIDEKKLVDFASQYIASLPGKNSNEMYEVNDFRPLTGQHEKIIEKGADPKSSVRITYHGPTTYDTKEDFALETLGEILTIKLVEQLREEEGGVYGVGARGNMSNMPYDWYSFTIGFPCGPENVDKLKNAALAEVDKLVANGPTQKDLDKVKETYLLDHKEDMKDNRFWLNSLKNADYLKKDANKLMDYNKNVEGLTTEYLHEVAKKYLSGDYLVGIHNPES
ncbi:insulinase family protein [Subsaximicrobium wynnwilliamsii]|uniref:Insulinase family protein n=1 Tax=Subsaximicrobium wynnwilliamsii TaxID=291179 RepID=A0A5C6ZM16_9FLAO|nr:insulinase family protein [Subsaximicrobium wynnwilliamsii]TXD85083.1 insulinase family protein [Subsaximicrobium wynnwilliamsii]TXD91126.1 insulinase family protein [Subsaximicrobium wynnwilliamsii]TXE04520.1 insulinase family protein [Subsaximicrobium wynnwilliamsii]